ncbi:MAG: hypothetical protein MK085_04975, partial [Phycisphaerales bacterium]|nr:hypothetical protein [Phycisphaerales bacterium]
PDAVLPILDRFDDRTDVPAAWLRIAAVGGMETEAGPGSISRRVAARALALLAGNGELAQVVDLAERYGLAAIGEEGFAFRYVRGVQAYRKAVKAREELRYADARAAFERAASELVAAVAEPDAGQFQSAVGGSLTLAGWSMIELERFDEAAGVFLQAAERSQGSRRADAEWGAIVALDRLIAAGGDSVDEIRRLRDERIAEFLDRFPADDRSPTLVVRRIADRIQPSPEDIETLLNVPRDHPTWEMARRRASQTLYAAFREAEVGTRHESGTRFLEVAEDLLERDRDQDAMFSDMRGLDGVLLRQVVEVATHPEVADIDRSNRWLAALELAGERGAFEDHPDLPNEVAYRRITLNLVEGDLVEAVARMQRMPPAPDTEAADRWTRIAARRLHNAGTERIEQGAPVGADVVQAVVVGGERLLMGEGDELDVALENERLLPIAVRVANGRAALYRSGGTLEDGEAALEIYQAILARRPRDGSILEASADLSRELGADEVSLDLWRRIATAAPQGGQRWWKARTNLLELLGKTDPAQARLVLDQHLQLHPEYGEPPWGDRLRALERALDIAGVEAGESAEQPGGEDRP